MNHNAVGQQKVMCGEGDNGSCSPLCVRSPQLLSQEQQGRGRSRGWREGSQQEGWREDSTGHPGASGPQHRRESTQLIVYSK